MKDPYEILGVQRTADEAALRAAYRKLAKKHHPDVNPGKPEAAARFGEISSAYDLLSDKDKRARFDRGEIDAEGHEVQRPFYRDTAGAERYGQPAGGFSQEDLEAFLAQAFGKAGQRSDWGATGRAMPVPGSIASRRPTSRPLFRSRTRTCAGATTTTDGAKENEC